ncbi:MAG: cytochrome b N-terminal domain-containing protein [Chloroflexota bacterium]
MKAEQKQGWFEERLELKKTLDWFLYRTVPRGVGWWYTLGSATMVAFILLLFTGLFLMMNYSASPDHAYDSVQYIMTQVPFGSLLRSIHFWSASAIVVLLGLHALRVFFMGSYKYPRELTWMVGVGLFLLVMGSSFTGYLLPWDQRAYWATNVGSGIAVQVPLVGPWLQKLLIGGSEIGTLTLTRFFTFHIGVVPPLLVLLVGFHIFMVVRQGISAPPGMIKPGSLEGKSQKEVYKEQYEATKKHGESFFPETVVRDAIVALFLVGIIFVLASVFPASSEAPADPTSTTYNPRPEWYFLFFFQFLKLFPGWLEPVAAVAVPAIAIVVLGSLPFFDKGLGRAWSARKRILSTGSLVLVVLIALEIGGAVTAPARPRGEVDPLVQQGHKVYDEINCAYCHSINGVGGAIGPDLSSVASQLTKEQITTYLLNPDSMVPNTLHPKLQFTTDELNALVAYLETLGAPVSYSAQAPILFDRDCAPCHIINGKGGTLGPDLSTVGSRRSIEFLEAFITDPASVIAGTTMPGFKNTLTSAQIQDLAAYLSSLKGGSTGASAQ